MSDGYKIDARSYSSILLMPDGTTREVVAFDIAEKWYKERAEYLHALSEAVSRADLAEKRMQQGFVEVCETSLLHVSKERDQLREYAGLLADALLRCLREIQPHHIPGDVYRQAQDALAVAHTPPQMSGGQQPLTDEDRTAARHANLQGDR